MLSGGCKWVGAVNCRWRRLPSAGRRPLLQRLVPPGKTPHADADSDRGAAQPLNRRRRPRIASRPFVRDPGLDSMVDVIN